MSLAVQLTTLQHCQAATDPPLEHLIFDYCEEICQEKSVNGLFSRKGDSHVAYTVLKKPVQSKSKI